MPLTRSFYPLTYCRLSHGPLLFLLHNNTPSLNVNGRQGACKKGGGARELQRWVGLVSCKGGCGSPTTVEK